MTTIDPSSASTSSIRRPPASALMLLLAAGFTCAAVAQDAEPAFMSGGWGQSACAAWNQDPILTTELARKWIKNDKGRGYKVLQLYRSDCGDKPTAELRISLVDSKAHCTYGGPVETLKLDKGADYLMHATTERWKQMGAGEYGPMKAMMFGRLSFSGPMGEAMGNMGPFGSFLLLAGKVPGAASCP
jgi:putative sterol carrier protein